ncbi:WD40 repeat-like protein [Mycena rosella]|uniref:WD40 repeat-like protein n=1 Tax=Mycena rosella TaxID=1033263 RepID=A0AAD7DAQ7_MYCRO|nr:WD40 repeat-like protein [Mycena rosella]
MVDVYSFVGDVDFLQKIKSLEDKALAIVKQTVECALFIQEYTAHDRAVRNTWIHTDEKIDDLSEALLKLKGSFEGRLTVQSLFMSSKILENVESLDTLKKLNPVDMNGSLRPTCLPGTRGSILDNITRWVAVPSDSGNILWFSGVAGSGKSTISTTVSQSFRELDRLGAFLFFDRNNRSQSDPGAVIRTIAYSLALSNPHIGAAISRMIHRDPAIVNAPLRTQFKALLLEPLGSAEHHIHGPILVILDALDECGDPNSRAPLLTLLADEFPKLPQFLRVFITSRRDSDIVGQFKTRFAEMDIDTRAPSSADDVELFLRHEIACIQRQKWLAPTWPGEERIQSLVHLAGGLFIWASTAARFINGYQPDEQLEILITQDRTAEFTDLDALYRIALQNSGPWHTEKKFAQNARAILACIVLGRVPMTDRTIDMILYSGKPTSAAVLNYLGCVVEWSSGKEARILHASFADYLMDPSRSGGQLWAINPQTDHHSLAVGCLRVLHTELRFNICGLEDSHLRNADVPGLAERIATMVSPQLSYSSCFCFDHIHHGQYSTAILEGLDRLLRHQFLYWLEVLSLLGRMPSATTGLGVAAEYTKGKHENLTDFVADAIKFVAAFSPAITQSTPHIYVSALPFAPARSKIVRQFAPTFPETLQFLRPSGEKWPSIQKIFRGHTGATTSVNFSPDGAWIASGSLDCTVRVWDAQTGALVAGPCEHTEAVYSVHFSPGGHRIASGSYDNTVRVWDTGTGALIAGPFIGHQNAVNSVHFSPDGTQIASGSYDETVRVWDAQTGTLVAGPFKGHRGSVTSVHFSPDGVLIASGSVDSTVRIWDAKTGTLVAGPFHGHTKQVTSVQFSPQGTHIGSGSADKTVRMWNIQTGACVAGPFTGHTDGVAAVNFSQDGALIASGSLDTTIRVWDVDTGTLAAGPFEGHTDRVTSVHFSPDGTQLASSSWDSTGRVWDAKAGLLLPELVEGHTSWVTSIQFSPDGVLIASGSWDKTVRSWDSQTGSLVAGPFKGHSSGVMSVNFRPEGTWLTSSASDNTLCVWEAKTGALVTGPFGVHRDEIQPSSVHFSPDGTHIASGGDNTVRVWDAQTGTLVAGPFEGHTEPVASVQFSPDGKTIASGSADTTVRIWDAHTGALVLGPLKGHTHFVTSVHFSPDGARIASGSQDATVRVWDAHTGGLQLVTGRLKGHNDGISSVYFSPNGQQIVSGSYEGRVCVWDAHAGTLVAGPFEGHTGPVLSVCFSPDGGRVASGSADATVRVWRVRMNHIEWPFSDLFPIDNGWVRDPAGPLIVWVPPWLRNGLYLPRNTLVICAEGTVKLDLTRFVHGTEWQKCIDPRFRDPK